MEGSGIAMSMRGQWLVYNTEVVVGVKGFLENHWINLIKFTYQ